MTWTHSPGGPVDEPFDIAVSMTSMLRPSLLAAVRSVFAQDFRGRVQVLIGIDRTVGSRDVLDTIRNECPPHMAVTVCDPGYSTARRNGGVSPSPNGGAMPAVLSWLAHARYLAYLDDDNWWAPDHLSSLHTTIRAGSGVGWAWSDRWLVRASDDRPLAIDRWMSAGTGRGLFKDRIGGMVDTNCLLIDRARSADALWRWGHTFHPQHGDHDRQIFKALLRKEPGAATGKATVYYRLTEEREATVRKMMSLPAEPPPTTNRITLATLHPWLLPREDGPEPRRRPPPPPADDPLRRWVQHMRPAGLVALWAGDGAWPLRLAAVNRASGLAATILAIDTWLAAPGSDTSRGRYSMARYGTSFEAFRSAVREAGEQDTICPLAACPRHAATVLESIGLSVDLVSMPADLPELEATLRAWWPLLPLGGTAMLHAPRVSGDHRSLQSFAAERGARVRRVRDGDGMLVAVYKMAAVTRASEAAA
jgi:hypothetical protein